MSMLIRIIAVMVLVIPAYLSGGCVGEMDADGVDGVDEADVGVDGEEVDGGGGVRLPLSEVDWLFGVGREMPDVEVDGDEELQLGEGEREVERQTLSADEVDHSVQLVVDKDAPSLEIRQFRRQEGSDAHYLEVTCHDPQETLDWRWIGGSRISERCDVDLTTAVRAVSIEPATSYRIAPTPRGFRILGDFERGSYEVSIAAGLRTDRGAVLKEEYEASITMPALSPSLAFTAAGRYLPRSAWEELTIEHRNVDEMDLEVRHIPQQNLPFWISATSESVDQRTSNQVAATEVALRNEEDRSLTTVMSVSELLGEPAPGLYQLQVTSGSTRAVSRLQVTDINLIAKRHEAHPDRKWEDNIDLWAVHMESTQPMSGVNMRAIKPSGAVMGRCRTNRQGHCRIELSEDETDPAPPMAIIAEEGRDLTYLKFDEVRTESEVQVIDGPAYLEDRTYLATLYGDRDLYRPGDTFHLVGALRDDDYSSAGADIPAEVVVRDPQRKIVVEETLRTDGAGLIDLSFPISEVAPTGRWEAELTVGKRRLETYSFHVEEFVPERLEVAAMATKPHFVADEEPTFEVEARYLFGASAAGSAVEIDCRLVPVASRAGEGNDYSFGPAEIDEGRKVIDLPTRNGVIGEDDTVEMACPKSETGLDGPMRVEATVAVAEGGSGRTTRASATAEVHPGPFEIGLKTDVDDLSEGDTFVVEGVLVDLDGEFAAGEEGQVTLEFYNVRRHTNWNWDRHTRRSSITYNYEFTLERVGDVQVKDGRFAVETTAAHVQYAYLVRARYGDMSTDLRIDRRGRMWSWSRNRNQDATPRARRPGRVDIDVPDRAYIGQPTTIEYDAPFAGRALLTVETDRVVDQQWVDAQEGVNQWTITVDGEEPNVYVSIMIVRDPREQMQNAFAPERAFGNVSLNVDSSPITADVELVTPEEVRPGQKLRIQVSAGHLEGPARATIAAVDEGILQLTNYATPDPVAAFWTPRTAGVETFDTIGWATQLPPMTATSRTGGGAYAEEPQNSESRIMPFRPVALWSGPVEIDEGGRAFVEFDVPNYRGRLRVMTSVFSDQKVGSAQADVLVRDPLTVQTTFPRHLTDGDEVRLPVFLANLTDEDRQVRVTIDARAYDLPGFDVAPEGGDSPLLQYLDGRTRQVDMEARTTKTIYFPISAARPAGAASVFVEAASGDLHTVDHGIIPLRPQGPRERTVKTIPLDDSGEIHLASHLGGWVPSSEETLFFASAFREPEAFDNLDYLVRYPYGCAEQTISSTRPMVFLSELVQGLDPAFGANGSGLRTKVDAGIARILSMQEASGGFRFWPNSWSTPYPWVTAYALHFLMDVSSQGYSVPRERIERATEWLVGQATGNHNGHADAYVHYVLALAGEPQTAEIRRAIESLPTKRSGGEHERAYLLKAALYLAGDRSFREELQNPTFDFGANGRDSGWGFYSHRRARAKILDVFVELFGQDEAGEALAEAVTDDLTSHGSQRRWTTQELVWGVTALGKWYRAAGMEDAQIALRLNGREVAGGHRASTHMSWNVMRASEFDDVTLSVDRGDYEGNLSLMISSQGVRQEPTAEYGGNGLEVSRTLLDEGGNAIGEGDIELGQVVYVRIHLRNKTSRTVRQLALADRLPAGLEVENPDLGAAELPGWVTSSFTWDTDHVNTRDDRVELFGSIPANRSVTFVYATRATLSGKFHAPSLEVEGMYEPEVWARAEGEVVRIVDPRELVD